MDDAFFYVRTLGYACAPQAEFDAYLVELGLAADGPLAALLRCEYEAALAEMRDYQRTSFHSVMSARRSVAVPC